MSPSFRGRPEAGMTKMNASNKDRPMRLDRTTDSGHVSSSWRNTTMADNQVARVLGGSPLAVLGRLILASVLVGVILAALGLDPFDIVRSAERLIRWLWNMGFDAFRWLWRYFLLGAVIVVPIWLIMRLVNGARGR